MKRKFMVLSLAMMSGLPQAVLARGGEKGGLAQSYSSWNGLYMPHYGSEGAAHPLMDHLSALPGVGQGAGPNRWRLEFSLPRADLKGQDDPSMGRGLRAGLSLKLDF